MRSGARHPEQPATDACAVVLGFEGIGVSSLSDHPPRERANPCLGQWDREAIDRPPESRRNAHPAPDNVPLVCCHEPALGQESSILGRAGPGTFAHR